MGGHLLPPIAPIGGTEVNPCSTSPNGRPCGTPTTGWAKPCPTIPDSKYMPGQGRYECEYVDAKGKAHDLSLLVASGDKVWLYDHNGEPMKVEKK